MHRQALRFGCRRQRCSPPTALHTKYQRAQLQERGLVTPHAVERASLLSWVRDLRHQAQLMVAFVLHIVVVAGGETQILPFASVAGLGNDLSIPIPVYRFR